MPKRDYSYDTRYESSPEQVKNRAARNAARAKVEKKVGKLPATVDVDHILPIKKGGTNAAGNLRVEPRSKNRGRK